jgi:hypothetical protein
MVSTTVEKSKQEEYERRSDRERFAPEARCISLLCKWNIQQSSSSVTIDIIYPFLSTEQLIYHAKDVLDCSLKP